MQDRIKPAFDAVHASENLKSHTLTQVLEKAEKVQSHKESRAKPVARILPALACFICLIVGGYWLYFLPAFSISIDVNPSLELRVNRFDKVVSIQGFNPEGQELAERLNVRFMDYLQALDQVMEDDYIVACLNRDELLSITVVGEDGAREDAILEQVEACTAAHGHSNVCCYAGNQADMEAAHEAGLSFGKYRAFLELQALMPDITVEDVQGMTMREIQDRIDACTHEEDGEPSSGSGKGHAQSHGRHHGQQD